MAALQKPVLLAVIGAAHGIKGEVRIKSFTGDTLALADYTPLTDAKGRVFDILDLRPQGEVVVARIKGVTDRNAAEALNGTELFVERASLPAEEEGEFYYDDLVGLSVRDETGAVVGKISAVQNFGGGDVLELNVQHRKGVLIPFTHAAVPEILIGEGYIRIDTVAAGLADDEDGDGEPDGGRAGGGFKARPRGPSDAGGNR